MLDMKLVRYLEEVLAEIEQKLLDLKHEVRDLERKAAPIRGLLAVYHATPEYRAATIDPTTRSAIDFIGQHTEAHDGHGPTRRALADHLNVGYSVADRHLKRLVSAGLVEAHDKWARQVRLTADGSALYRAIDAARRASTLQEGGDG